MNPLQLKILTYQRHPICTSLTINSSRYSTWSTTSHSIENFFTTSTKVHTSHQIVYTYHQDGWDGATVLPEMEQPSVDPFFCVWQPLGGGVVGGRHPQRRGRESVHQGPQGHSLSLLTLLQGKPFKLFNITSFYFTHPLKGASGLEIKCMHTIPFSWYSFLHCFCAVSGVLAL